MIVEKELEKLGLTANQATIYVLLLKHGELRVQEIADASGIPRSSVYESLKGLLQHGLVEEIVDDNFKKIRAYPIDGLKHNLKADIGHLQDQLDTLGDLEQVLSNLPYAQLQPSTAVRYFRGVSGARQLLWNTLKTKDVIYVYSEWGRGSYVGMKFYENFVNESKQRDIQERVLINPSRRVLESIKTYANTPTSRTRVDSIRTLGKSDIVITGETFMYDNTYAQVYLKNEEINGFEIENPKFLKTQRSIFENLWKTAPPLKLD